MPSYYKAANNWGCFYLQNLFRNGRTIHRQIAFKIFPHPSLLGAFCSALSNTSPVCRSSCALNFPENRNLSGLLNGVQTASCFSEDSVQSAHGCSGTCYQQHTSCSGGPVTPPDLWNRRRTSNITSPLASSSFITS